MQTNTLLKILVFFIEKHINDKNPTKIENLAKIGQKYATIVELLFLIFDVYRFLEVISVVRRIFWIIFSLSDQSQSKKLNKTKVQRLLRIFNGFWPNS